MRLRAIGLILSISAFCALDVSCLARAQLVPVGVARVDITPDYPVRLHGYLARKAESVGVEEHIWAKSLPFGSDAEGAAVLVTVDSLGVPDAVVTEVAARLKRKAGIARERFAVASSHTHSAPCLTGVATNIFALKLPDDQQARIDRYTRELTDNLEKAALAALDDRQPSTLAWAQGKVDFANNRRTKGGPVDQALPMLRVAGSDGRIRAILVGYACHCTTLDPKDNLISGDWAGYAQRAIERDHPGAMALTVIGCGADANPRERGKRDDAERHGRAIAEEVNRLLTQSMEPLASAPVGRFKRVRLPFDTLPGREELEKLVMVFLAGEVVVDYSLRLKHELDAGRLWVAAYANDLPCYIPSERILREGGYEGGGAMVYYARPTRLRPGIEDLIVGTVHEIVPQEFAAQPKQAERPKAAGMPHPLSPQEALK